MLLYKILTKKVKSIEFRNKKIYQLNNIDKQRLNELTQFPIGSITKVFVSLALVLLHQSKVIDIHGSVGRYIDIKEIKNINIIDIINHVSGMKTMNDNYKWGHVTKKYHSATEVFDSIKTEKLIEGKPGEYLYSNVGYYVLGTLIEKMTGMHWFEYIKDMILKPLGMKRTGIDEPNTKLYSHDGKRLTKYQRNEWSFASSSGQMVSCIADLVLFSRFPKLLSKINRSLISSFEFFNPENHRSMFKNGTISGATADVFYKYNDKWHVKDIYISLRTVDN